MSIPPIGVTTVASLSTSAAAAPSRVPSSAVNSSADSVSLGASAASAGVEEKSAVGQAAPNLTKQGKPILSDSQVELVLDKVMAQAAPSDLASVSAAKAQAPQGFYIAGGGSASGMELESAPTRADVADYQYISQADATDNYETNVRPNLNFVQKAVIRSYCTFAYAAMNKYLNGAKGSPTGTLRRATECAHKALDKFEVPQGSILYRTSNLNDLHNYVSNEDFATYEGYDKAGKTRELAQILDARLQGTEVIRKTFISTTINPKFDFEDRPKVATKLYVGEGVKGIYVAADTKLTPFADEQEYLLSADTKVTVVGVDYDKKNNGLVLHVFLGDMPKTQEN